MIAVDYHTRVVADVHFDVPNIWLSDICEGFPIGRPDKKREQVLSNVSSIVISESPLGCHFVDFLFYCTHDRLSFLTPCGGTGI